MPTAQPNSNTIAVILVFAVIYMAIVFRKTLTGKFDLYDFIMLSMVAIVPGVFTLIPTLATTLSHLTGVLFPFVIMFGALFLVVFVFMHRMTVRLHKIERQTRRLIQELSLLAVELEQSRQNARIGA